MVEPALLDTAAGPGFDPRREPHDGVEHRNGFAASSADGWLEAWHAEARGQDYSGYSPHARWHSGRKFYFGNRRRRTNPGPASEGGRAVSARPAALLVALLTCFAATAAPTAQQRQQTFARLPDWTGIWIADDGIMTRLGLRNDVEGDTGPTFKDLILRKHPPYNTEWEARYQTARKAAGPPAT